MQNTTTEAPLESDPSQGRASPAPPWFPSLKVRVRQDELMDTPGLDAAAHLHALRGIERIHQITGGARYFWPHLEELARQSDEAPLRVLDIATASGDIPVALWRRAKRAKVSLDISGCDISPRAIALAREKSFLAKCPIRFFEHDVLRDGVPEGYDVVTCSLFLHHLEDAQAVALLSELPSVTRAFMILDLVRSRPGYVLAYWGSPLVTTSQVVGLDAPLSVMSAYTVAEAHALARRAGLAEYRITPTFPFRFLLSWRAP